MWSPGARRPSRAAKESRTISWMTMLPKGVSFPPTIRKPSSSSGSSRNISTTLASATRLERTGVESGEGGRVTRVTHQTRVWKDVCVCRQRQIYRNVHTKYRSAYLRFPVSPHTHTPVIWTCNRQEATHLFSQSWSLSICHHFN